MQEKLPAKKALFIFLKKNWDLQIFLHNEGEEFWLVGPDFPIEMVSTRLPGVNFINILHTSFLYEHHFGSFFYVHVTREKDRGC